MQCWCLFAKSYLSQEDKKNDKKLEPRAILCGKSGAYTRIMCGFESQATLACCDLVGELMKKHVSYLNDKFIYVYGYFPVNIDSDNVYQKVSTMTSETDYFEKM